MDVFDRWISLGNYCLPKFRINRFICRKYLGLSKNDTALAHAQIEKTDRNLLRSINGGASIFDWAVVENYDKAIKHIESRFSEYRLQGEFLTEVIDEQGKVTNVQCSNLGVLFPHLFSHNHSFEDWRGRIDVLNSKVARMAFNFVGCERYYTLYFVLMGINEIHKRGADRLTDALAMSRRFPEHDFRLLVCCPDGAVPNDTRRIYYRNFDPTPDDPESPWFGSADGWDRVFEGFDLSAPVPKTHILP